RADQKAKMDSAFAGMTPVLDVTAGLNCAAGVGEHRIIHASRCATHNPQPTTHNPQPTTHNPQPTTHKQQPTTHNPPPTTPCCSSLHDAQLPESRVPQP